MSGVDAPAPWRIAFDNARDPYTARNALGAEKIGGGGGGGGAPDDAQYIVAATDATLTAERVLTDTASITWDFTTPGQAKASTTAGGGNVSNSGTPTLGQYAKWVTATTIQGVSAATVLGDIGAQPLDADLTAIAALTGTNTIYYRSAANTWSPVVISTGLAFSGGTLTCTVSAGGNVSSSGTITVGQIARWASATTIESASLATLAVAPSTPEYITAAAHTGLAAERVLTDTATIAWDFGTAGQAKANVTVSYQPADTTLTALAAYNTNGLLTQTAADTFAGRSIAVPAAGISITNANGVAGNPTLALADDLAALEALTGTNTIYYRSGTSAWTAVTFSGLTFSGGVLTATAGGAPTNAEYITSSTNATLSAERVLTNTATITWDFATAGQAKANAVAGGGNVSNSGTPTVGQWARWVTATTIEGVAAASTGFVQKAGDTMTGKLTVNVTASASENITLTGTSGGVGIHITQVSVTPTTWLYQNGNTFAIGNDSNDIISVDLLAEVASLNATPTAGDNSTKIATTAFVQGAVGAWTAWTPTITADAGTITSTTINSARYTRAGKAITASFDITITNAGTGGSYLNISLPVTASASGGGAVFGQEVAATGVALTGNIAPSATVMKLLNYAASNLIITGYRIRGVAIYEGV